MAQANILRAITLATIQLSFGFLKTGAVGLISGQIVSQISANAKLLITIIKNKTLLSKVSKNHISFSKKYKKFPQFSVLSTFMTNASLRPHIVSRSF